MRKKGVGDLRQIGKKCGGQGGAAMMMALMFFLLCACVGSIVVTAAAANAGKAAKMREEEQKYLAVKSAANTVAQMMQRSPYVAKFTEEYTYEIITDYASDGTPSTRYNHTWGMLKNSISVSAFEANAPMASLLKNDIRNIFLHNTKLSDPNATPVLNSVISGQGGTPGPWNESEVDLGPEEYTMELVASGYPDIKSLVTLKIDRGTDNNGSNIYEATITAKTVDGSHIVELYCQATIPTMGKVLNTTHSVTGGNPTIDKTITTTDYSLRISWDVWHVKYISGGSP